MEVATPKKGEGVTLLHDGINFTALPEGCISAIIALTTPKDACRLALVSKLFQSASESDLTWSRFLPSDCDLIVAQYDRGETELADFQTKKQLFMRFAERPLLFQGGTQSFWLHKPSGKKCWIIAARSLCIKDSNSVLCWHWTSIPESRFPEVIELVRIQSIDIRVKIHASMLSPETRYTAYLVFKMTENAYGLNTVSRATVFPPRGEGKCKADSGLVYLSIESEQLNKVTSSGFGDFIAVKLPSDETILVRVDQCSKLRSDGWKEVKIGEFFINSREEGNVWLYLDMKDADWKSGLIVEGIEVRPGGQQDQNCEGTVEES